MKPRVKHKVAAVAAVGIFGGCARAEPRATALGAMTAPPHAPSTAADWADNERRARALLSSEASPARLVGTGLQVEQSLTVAAETCYELAITWAYPADAMVAVVFLANEEGKRTNASRSAAQERIAGPGGVLRYCADEDGPARLTVTSLEPASGAIRPRERHEYAYAIAAQEETGTNTERRRAAEKRREAGRRATIANNLNQSDPRSKEEQALDWERARSRCRMCRTAAQDCLRSASARTCRSEYQRCVWGSSQGAARHEFDANPCGEIKRGE
ncbi:MAG: hypothetical protein AAGA56_08215 [Myxococcota bacterium]